MKILMINSVCGIRSTGRICTDLAEMLEAQGHECKIAYGRETVPLRYQKYALRVGSSLETYAHALKARLLDCSGFGSRAATRRLIKQIKEYAPDIIHLHNIHGYYIHVGELFRFLRQYSKPVLWSFYDCWSFTGHCAHFDFNGCEQWKTGCEKCAFTSEYPKSLFSRSKRNYQTKKELFTNLPTLHLSVPSRWMQSRVSQSYLKEYPVHMLPNGIDIAAFSPKQSSFKTQHGLDGRFVVLGVSSFWNKMKGLEFFNRLADELDGEKFKVVLVGKAEDNTLSKNILHIPATNNIDELCEIYTVADVFVNPTLQETQGLTTVEALACGTPVIVFRAGGAAECVSDGCGIVVDKGDYRGLVDAVMRVQSGESAFDEAHCISKAQEYDTKRLYQDFIRCYTELV